MIVDQTDWAHILVSGEDRVRFMQGMCTANIERLAPNDWLRASVLDHRGRVQSVIEVADRGDRLLITCQPDLGHKTKTLLEKYAIMDEVEFAFVDQPMHRVWTTPKDVWSAPPVFAAPPSAPASEDEIEIARVEAGMPRYGIDVDEDHFPFESLLARHIDYDKGCYLGQEPVARVHHRGSPNKFMRGLAIAGDSLIEPGTPVAHPERENAGQITSCVRSPRFGIIALAYLHRSINQPGNQVRVAEVEATVVELPFS